MNATVKTLIVEDNPLNRSLLEAVLTKWGCAFESLDDGEAAWELIARDSSFGLFLLDWELPGLSGLEICKRVRASFGTRPAYVILITGRSEKQDLVLGLNSGADDYIAKPFHAEELNARIQVGLRILTLQKSVADRVKELEDALAQVRELQGLIPICSYCKQVRDDKNYWQQVESYISARSSAVFTHGICPPCKKIEMARLAGKKA